MPHSESSGDSEPESSFPRRCLQVQGKGKRTRFQPRCVTSRPWPQAELPGLQATHSFFIAPIPHHDCGKLSVKMSNASNTRMPRFLPHSAGNAENSQLTTWPCKLLLRDMEMYVPQCLALLPHVQVYVTHWGFTGYYLQIYCFGNPPPPCHITKYGNHAVRKLPSPPLPIQNLYGSPN